MPSDCGLGGDAPPRGPGAPGQGPGGEQSLPDLRCLSELELARVGADSLREHLSAQALVAHRKHAPLTVAGVEALLADPECVRYPTRLVFEFGEMAAHQFADLGPDPRQPGQAARVLYLRPILRDRPDLVMLAVAYMIPVLNYGDIVTDDLCVRYGATLLGMMELEFYDATCRLADYVGAEVRLTPQQPPTGRC